MGWSGLGYGAAQGLEKVLERRLQEELRRQQEQQKAEELALRRLEQAALERDRQADRNYRQGVVDRQDAAAVMEDVGSGPVTSQQADQIEKSPAGRVRLRRDLRIIQGVRPIGGASVLPGAMAQASGLAGGVDRSSQMGGASAMADAGAGAMDESGPQRFNDLAPTRAQAQDAYQTGRRKEILGLMSRAGNEAQRRALALQAAGEQIDVPSYLVGQTGVEQTAQQLAEEARNDARWMRQNNITNDQANKRQAASDQFMRNRAADARDDKPPTMAQSTLAGYASRLEQAEPTILSVQSEIAKMNAASFETQLFIDRPTFQSKTMQKYLQSSRNMINALLRRESGAVISPSEFAEARQQYLPQPNDSDEVLEMKRQNRMLNFSNFRKGAGKGYQSIDDALNEPRFGTSIEEYDFVPGQGLVRRGGPQ